ncbi:hypothetical protein H310_01563 [Aphanomyces invadans]|uniref:Uncharacterized protein n=1 Tax=Aphanomyces invadans TaxID=157072 RepID=A0A024UTX4_9STRA|nr:hypothetical protein H310_01563 [Aphanomyces invadans]ETW09113.1 hypothetical protein H310_01563 [Aphanomyces invadans]|eukprot:XP_008862918.1 hypothetical protein H310_01563 [Aphanomyces invadans]
MLSSKLPTPKVVVEWCPNDSGIFAVGSDALTLFECQSDRDVPSSIPSTPGLGVRPSLGPSSPRRTTQRRSKNYFRSLQTDAEVTQVRSMQWCPLPKQLIAAGVGTGKVVLSDFTQPVVELLPPRTSSSLSNISGKAPRPSMHGTIGCNTVAWNQQNPQLIAAGFEKVRADCCAFVWDLTTQASISSVASTPFDALDSSKSSSYRGHGFSSPQQRPTLTNELANSEAVVALDWLPSEPSCLATGTGFRWLRIYDVRAKTRFMEFSAHTKGVFGVVFDVHRPHLLATYSDDPKEPIKVWDIRSIQGARHDNEPVVTIPVSKVVSQIAWSPTQAGILASTALDDRAISLWDIEHQIQLMSSATSVISKPFKRRSTQEPVFAFSWQASNTSNEDQAQTMGDSNQMLLAIVGGKVETLSIHDTMPLALSSQHVLGFACGTLLYADPVENPDDIAMTMMRRVRAGYSMNVLTSLQLFTQDDPTTRDMRFVWQWVDQVESLRRLSVAQTDVPTHECRGSMGIQQRAPLREWPVNPQALVTSGVQHLLGLTQVPSTTVPYETSLRDPVLGCLVYDSTGRRTALLACQWDPDGSTSMLHFNSIPRPASIKFGLNQLYDDGESNAGNLNAAPIPHPHHAAMPTLHTLITQCEAAFDFDRAAALAVFHGDIQAAVAVLQRGAECPTPSPTRDVRQLVAMAVAGYSIGTTAHNPLWSSMCHQLLRRPEIQNPGTPRYLHALCSFLVAAKELSTATQASSMGTRSSRTSLSNASLAYRRPSTVQSSPEDPPLFTSILHDETLLLSDRTAFACRYLPLDALTRFIDICVETCTRQGNLQGLLLVGLEPTILQEYLDRTGDIQTVALLVARVSAMPEDTAAVYAKWIGMYRDLLNQWQLFHQRALFDVGRTQLEDQLKGFRDVALSLGHAMATPTAPNETRAAPPPPPHLYVRCNFCGSPLTLSSLVRVGAGDWLLKAKQKLNNCSSCKRPLPQCALCLLPFGTLNPYLELAMRKGQDKKSLEHDATTTSPATADNLADLSSIPFVEWFTWCQTCRHGGHAHHMADWFATHEVCPVSDCDCTCKRLDVNSIGRSTALPAPDKPTPDTATVTSPVLASGSHHAPDSRSPTVQALQSTLSSFNPPTF